MNFGSKFPTGLTYEQFLARYANPSEKQRWDDFHRQVGLTDEQKALLKSFTRDMQVLVMAGAWCGDCVNQCPIFDHFARQLTRPQPGTHGFRTNFAGDDVLVSQDGELLTITAAVDDAGYELTGRA